MDADLRFPTYASVSLGDGRILAGTASAYEKIVVAFRSAAREVHDRVEAKVAVTMGFVRLVKFIVLRGLITTAVRCPHCNGRIGLLERNATAKCWYRDSAIRVIEVYEVLKDLLKGFT